MRKEEGIRRREEVVKTILVKTIVIKTILVKTIGGEKK